MAKSKNFDFAPEEVRDHMTDEELDEALKSMGISPEEEKAVRKVCKLGLVIAPKLKESKEEKLLRAIFEDSDDSDGDEDFPSTLHEKLGYAKYITMKSLESISKVIVCFGRLVNLSKLNAPDVIINNECRLTLQSLYPAWADINDARAYVRRFSTPPPRKRRTVCANEKSIYILTLPNRSDERHTVEKAVGSALLACSFW